MTSKISGITLTLALASALAVSIDAASRRRCPAAMALASLNTISGNGTSRSSWPIDMLVLLPPRIVVASECQMPSSITSLARAGPASAAAPDRAVRTAIAPSRRAAEVDSVRPAGGSRAGGRRSPRRSAAAPPSSGAFGSSVTPPTNSTRRVGLDGGQVVLVEGDDERAVRRRHEDEATALGDERRRSTRASARPALRAAGRGTSGRPSGDRSASTGGRSAASRSRAQAARPRTRGPGRSGLPGRAGRLRSSARAGSASARVALVGDDSARPMRARQARRPSAAARAPAAEVERQHAGGEVAAPAAAWPVGSRRPHGLAGEWADDRDRRAAATRR